MFYTARQLEDLWKANGANGQVVLPYRARLTPNAQDWIKARRVSVGYSDQAPQTPAPAAPVGASVAPVSALPTLWWCDGPCGTAKAALTAQARESNLIPIDRPPDAKHLVAVVKHVAAELKAGRASGAVLIVHSAATAMLYANRCPSLRAVVGTCLDSVEQGIQQVAANVLVIEHPYKTLQQIRNLLGRFVRAPRTISEELRQQLQELATCG